MNAKWNKIACQDAAGSDKDDEIRFLDPKWSSALRGAAVCPATAPAQGGCRYNPAATPLPSRVVARRAVNYCAAVRFWRQRLLFLAWSLPSGREGGLPRCHLCNCRCPRPCVPLAARRPGKRRLARNSCPLPACTRPIDPHGQGRTYRKPRGYLLLFARTAIVRRLRAVGVKRNKDP